MSYSIGWKSVSIVSIMLLSLVAACSEEEVAPANVTVGEPVKMEVFKQASCGCCGKWVDHAQSTGFDVAVKNRKSMTSIKREFDIAPQYQSCHTAVASGYVFEGHVPASLIQRFLAEKPADAIGLAVPGMPVGSPGMEMGDRFDSYDVLLLKTDGTSEIYAHVAGPQKIDQVFHINGQ